MCRGWQSSQSQARKRAAELIQSLKAAAGDELLREDADLQEKLSELGGGELVSLSDLASVPASP